MKKYVLGIDQSTQGTKGIIFDGSGKIIARTDLAHDQIINEKGWVEHNPDQIMKNVIQVVKNVVEKAGIDKEEILTLGISNQRETAVCWNKNTGRPVYNAIVWQCAVVKQSVTRIQEDGYAQIGTGTFRNSAVSILFCSKDRMGTSERTRSKRGSR